MKSLHLLSSAAALSATLAIAQQSSPIPTTVSLFIPAADMQPLVASVVSAVATETIYKVTCPEDADPVDCGFVSGATITHGPAVASDSPAVWGGIFSGGPDPVNELTAAWRCEFQGTMDPLCTMSSSGPEVTDMGSVTDRVPQDYITFFPVVVTGGQEKLAAAATETAIATPTATSSSSASSGMVGSVSGTNPSRSGTGTASGSESGSGTATRTGSAASVTETGNAGVRMVIEKVVVIGAAAAGVGYTFA